MLLFNDISSYGASVLLLIDGLCSTYYCQHLLNFFQAPGRSVGFLRSGSRAPPALHYFPWRFQSLSQIHSLPPTLVMTSLLKALSC